ncbi:MAG TPA: hypothetical protein VMC62_05585 [Longilinea sp.]|nr:hypothetical protein [Longilinea sp.]
MDSSEERLKVLQMIQDGKITAEEGMQLLEALGQKSTKQTEPAETSPARSPRWFRLRVVDTNSGKVRVNVRMPVSVINAGIKMGARFSPEVEGLNTSELLEHIRSGDIGQIVDVTDEEDGEHVEVFLE